MNVQKTPNGKPCGEKVNVNGRNLRCKYHFNLNHFTSIAQMKRLVQPDPRDGRTQKDCFKLGDVEYDILLYSLDGSPARGEFPADDPIRFDREPRIYEPTQTIHHGWLPVWESGLTWPYWSYQNGFGGDYKGRMLRAAMRFEIYDQIEDARFGMGVGMHVHHKAPNTFHVISSAWLGIKGLFPGDIELYEPHPSFKQFKDRDLAFEWQDFHAKHADLEVLTPEEHRAVHAAQANVKGADE